MTKIPWYIWLSILGVTSATIGGHWDISWHRSIGRDSFWTAPHLAIQLCGVIAGITCGYLILWTTFTHSHLRKASVNVLGFRGPLGAFICAWGGFTMITSAPFDDWWHNAYGLDVKILSPPHVVLAAGILAIEIGALMLVLGYMNRAQGDERRRLSWLYLYLGSMIVVVMQILSMEHTGRVQQHTGWFYISVAIAVPTALTGVAIASGRRWGATIIAGAYMLFTASLIWILPRFPAEPKLGPVLNPVTQFIPPSFPLLLIVPAIAIDLLRPRLRGSNKWLQGVILGSVFFTVFIGVQWFFANFLMTPAAANEFFGTMYRDYGTPANSPMAWSIFWPPESNFGTLMAIAWIVSIVTARIGVGWGEWMSTVKR